MTDAFVKAVVEFSAANAGMVMTGEEKSWLIAFCGGIERTAALVSYRLQTRGGLRCHVDRMPDLSLLTDEERQWLGEGQIPPTML